jgi:hypothetical protein
MQVFISEIISSPGLVKAHKGDDVELIWEQDFPSEHYRIWHTTVNSEDNRLLNYISSEDISYYGTCDSGRCSSITNATGIKISSVNTTDARRYILSFPNVPVRNDDAIIYIYCESFFTLFKYGNYNNSHQIVLKCIRIISTI